MQRPLESVIWEIISLAEWTYNLGLLHHFLKSKVSLINKINILSQFFKWKFHLDSSLISNTWLCSCCSKIDTKCADIYGIDFYTYVGRCHWRTCSKICGPKLVKIHQKDLASVKNASNKKNDATLKNQFFNI